MRSKDLFRLAKMQPGRFVLNRVEVDLNEGTSQIGLGLTLLQN